MLYLVGFIRKFDFQILVSWAMHPCVSGDTSSLWRKMNSYSLHIDTGDYIW